MRMSVVLPLLALLTAAPLGAQTTQAQTTQAPDPLLEGARDPALGQTLGAALAPAGDPALAPLPPLEPLPPLPPAVEGQTRLGTVLTDLGGMTLYTFDRDPAGQSTCQGVCATKWPPFLKAELPPLAADPLAPAAGGTAPAAGTAPTDPLAPATDPLAPGAMEMMTDPDAMPGPDWSLVTRADGTEQWAYKGKPLYLFSSDRKPGDVRGQGFNQVWTVARP